MRLTYKQLILLAFLPYLALAKMPENVGMLPIHVTATSHSSIVPNEQPQSEPTHTYVIKRGNTLAKLFLKSGIGTNLNQMKIQLEQLMDADNELLALETIEPNQTLKLTIDANHHLQRLELIYNAAKRVVFSRISEHEFNYKVIERQGIWRKRAVEGTIEKSFYLSMKKAGFRRSNIMFLKRLLEKQLRFNRDVRRLDRYSILVNEQYIDGFFTGNRTILGISYHTSRGKGQRRRLITYSAWLHEDGDFYTSEGKNISKPFLKLPVINSLKLTSNFNPWRKHPVTGKLRPHHGIDLGTPIGTKIIAPGDGVVTFVSEHKYAGKYIVIEHQGTVTTRFLHLSKTFVREGQSVKRGDIIALSGNSGRTTGPHLHYELHLNGHPVNPLKAKIKFSTQLSSTDLTAFHARSQYHQSFLGQKD
jgi:murein DD-endopeptidase